MQRSFSGGELSPTLAARADTARYQTGLRTCRNFMVQRHGGVANRPGTRYVASTKAPTGNVQFLRYVSETLGQSVVIECGANYFRFYQNGAQVAVAGVAAWNIATPYVVGDLVVQGGVNYYCILAHTANIPPNATFWYPLVGNIYEVPHPFSGTQLPRWEQSGSVVALVHPDVVPQDLTFFTLTRWTVTPVTTVPAVAVPGSLTGPASVGTTGQRFQYRVTAADATTYEESEPSTPFAIYRPTGPTKTNPFELSWAAVAGAAEYYLYLDPFRNNVYGFIGSAVGQLTFNDIGFPPDFSQSPSLAVRLFNAPNLYPSMVAYYQQRRWYAASRTEPETVWSSRIGFPSNFGISSPLQEDDAITLRLAGKQRQPVRHLIGLRTLVLLTGTGEWLVGGAGDGPISPTSLQAEQISYWGASAVVPVVIGQSVIYVQARGRIVRDLALESGASGLTGRDLTLFAGHLFDDETITKLDYAQSPQSVVWAVREDGVLLGLTYVPEDDTWGWHRHDTGAVGAFKDVCVVPESGEDAVYLLVTRTINAVAVRYIERMASRVVLARADAFFMDAGLSYSGTPTAVVSGLGHLEGQIVAVLGDGQVVFNGDPSHPSASSFRVTAGALTLSAAYSVIHVGIPIRYAEVETLDLDVSGSTIRDKRKRVQSLTVLVEKSAQSFWAGPDSAHLLAFKPETWQASSGLVDDALEHNITAGFTDHGRFVIRQTEPLPLTLLGVLPSVEVGG
jgi:hypothetical protein